MSIVDESGRHSDIRDSVRGMIASALDALRIHYWRHPDIASFVVLLLFVVMVIGFAQLRPIYNWDALAYLAASMRDSFDSASQIHNYAYSVLRDAAPPKEFAELTQADAYRVRQFTDPEAFVSMLGMYEVKWLYIWLMKALIPIVGPLGAPEAINNAALIILVGSIGLWLRSTRLSGYAPLVVGLLFLLQFQGFSGTQQPDFLANAFMVASLLSYERGRNLLGSALMILTVLTRPDQVATAGVIMACAWFLRDRNTLAFAVTFLVAVAAYLLISRSVHAAGWWPHFWFSTYQIQETMQGFTPDFSIKVYVTAVAQNLYRSLFQNTWLAAYGMALAWAGWIYWRAAISDRRLQVLLVAMLLAIPAKFMVFPLHDGRIYFAPLLVFFMLAFASCMKNANTSTTPARD